MGPTAAGKTALALALHEQFPVHLISVDSAQVYRGLDIGSAKLDRETRRRYPHALIDIREPEQTYSAAEFVADAEMAMRQAVAAGKLPVLVGGTTLYFRALLYGLDALPAADPVIRTSISAQARERGWPSLHAQLCERDPDSARRIRPGDAQRIARALEVLELTGQGLSVHHRQSRRPRFCSLRIVLGYADRARLHERIANRVDHILQQGLIDEVSQLRLRPGVNANLPAMRSVGYRQVWEWLDQSGEMAALRACIIAATRQLAKRQLTGLRKFHRTLWYDVDHEKATEMVKGQVARFAREFAAGWG